MSRTLVTGTPLGRIQIQLSTVLMYVCMYVCMYSKSTIFQSCLDVTVYSYAETALFNNYLWIESTKVDAILVICTVQFF